MFMHWHMNQSKGSTIQKSGKNTEMTWKWRLQSTTGTATWTWSASTHWWMSNIRSIKFLWPTVQWQSIKFCGEICSRQFTNKCLVLSSSGNFCRVHFGMSTKRSAVKNAFRFARMKKHLFKSWLFMRFGKQKKATECGQTGQGWQASSVFSQNLKFSEK